MTQLARNSVREPERFRYLELTLAASQDAYINGIAVIASATGLAQRYAAAASGIIVLGTFANEVHTGAGQNKKVTVDLGREVTARWFGNGASADAVTAADIGRDAYGVDDDTVSDVVTGRTKIGTIWGYNVATNEVLVEIKA